MPRHPLKCSKHTAPNAAFLFLPAPPLSCTHTQRYEHSLLSSGVGAAAVTTWCVLHGQSPGEAAVITVVSTITALVSWWCCLRCVMSPVEDATKQPASAWLHACSCRLCVIQYAVPVLPHHPTLKILSRSVLITWCCCFCLFFPYLSCLPSLTGPE